MADYAALSQKKSELIRKGLEGGVYTGRTSVEPITWENLFDEDGELKELPEGYGELGWITNDGAQYSRSVDTSDMTGWGSNEPLRSDITADTTTMQVAAMETNAKTLGLFYGTDLGDMVINPNGSLEIRKPATPKVNIWRTLSVAMDKGDDGEIYMCRFLPRAKVTDYADQAYNNGDDGITYGVTFTGFRDSAFKTSESVLFGGPGWIALLDAMGFDTTNVTALQGAGTGTGTTTPGSGSGTGSGTTTP